MSRDATSTRTETIHFNSGSDSWPIRHAGQWYDFDLPEGLVSEEQGIAAQRT